MLQHWKLEFDKMGHSKQFHYNPPRVCETATTDGHLEVLKWARENGCPWDEETCS